MLVPFNHLSPKSRIWIYQCNRLLSDSEIEKIKSLGNDFVTNWTAHQQTLAAGFEVFHNLFLVIAVDESVNDASGCSIDKAFGFIKQLEKMFAVELLNRMNVAIRNNNQLQVLHISELTALLNQLNSKNKIEIFNNLVATKEELEQNWLQPVEKSWVANYI